MTGPDPTSLERIVPEALEDDGATGRETLALHLRRYEFAARCLVPGTALDIACGVGYGTRCICDMREDITAANGVDVSQEAVAYAISHYQTGRMQFFLSGAMEFQPPTSFDNVVSLETIEHIAAPERFLERVLGFLRPGGIFVGSVPITPSVDANPHHVTDFSESSFRKLVERHGMVAVAEFRQRQPYNLLSVIRGREARSTSIRRNLPAYYLKTPSKLLLRAYSTLRVGFENRYITIAWKKVDGE